MHSGTAHDSLLLKFYPGSVVVNGLFLQLWEPSLTYLVPYHPSHAVSYRECVCGRCCSSHTVRTSLSIVLFSSIRQSQDEAVTKLRQEFEARASEQLKKYDQKLVTLRDELELRRKTEIHEIEEVHMYIRTYVPLCVHDAH